MPNSSSNTKRIAESTLKIVFDGDVKPNRIATFIELLSEIYGDDLNIVSTTNLPPDQEEDRKVA